LLCDEPCGYLLWAEWNIKIHFICFICMSFHDEEIKLINYSLFLGRADSGRAHANRRERNFGVLPRPGRASRLLR
ncbi:hypothetical protein, partial [Vibrio fluvialis]|uniref:hypothetical protein n=1 Tax=Vibrio fluvialis TaxID=676 RepID=UPI001ED94CE4